MTTGLRWSFFFLYLRAALFPNQGMAEIVIPEGWRNARFKALAHTSRMESSSLARGPDPGRSWSN